MSTSPTVKKRPAAPYREGDVFLCSYPKMGRTWVKQFLAQYLSLLFALEYPARYSLMKLMEIVPSEWYLAEHPDCFAYTKDLRVPRVRFAHYQFDSLFIDRPVIWLTRGIEDTLVSYYYHELREKSLSEFVRETLDDVIRWLNGWWEGLPQTERWLHVTYEDLSEDSAREFRAVLEFIGLAYDPQSFREALRRASFAQMRKDQEGTKVERVRKGLVGGYRAELSKEDLQFIQRTVHQQLRAEGQYVASASRQEETA